MYRVNDTTVECQRPYEKVGCLHKQWQEPFVREMRSQFPLNLWQKIGNSLSGMEQIMFVLGTIVFSSTGTN